jgi:YidC/Oxa1 family membrane protein insertase
MMRLYKEHNVNPMAGCLPLLVQLPIMIVLFQVLMNYKVAAGATFIGIRLDLSVFDGLVTATKVILNEGARAGITDVLRGIFTNPAGLLSVGLYVPGLILTGLICFMMWYQQRMSGAGDNPQMAAMNVVMPVIMAFMCLGLPGGVVVYWGTSSLIGIVQQIFVSKRAKIELAKKPVLYKNKPIDGKGEILTLENDGQGEKEEEYEEAEYEDDEEYDDEDENGDEYEYEDDEEYEDEEEEYEDEKDQRGKK